MVFEIGDEEITIIGFIDAYDPETATIYDLKTTRFVKWQAEKGFIPRQSHIAQVQCYATMLENYGIPAARLVLVYVDDKDIVPLQVPLGNRREWMIRRTTQFHQAFTKETEPTPEIGSTCKYCPHLNVCPQSEGTRFEAATA
jgi:CRISPR/Cas system-associated exonuclease Cas4 (RecB family)